MRETQNPTATTAGSQCPASTLWTICSWTSPSVSPYLLRVEAQKQGDKWPSEAPPTFGPAKQSSLERGRCSPAKSGPSMVSGQVKTWGWSGTMGKFSFLFLFGLSVYSYISVTNGYYFYKKEIKYQAQPPTLSWLYPQIIAYCKKPNMLNLTTMLSRAYPELSFFYLYY